MLALAIVVVAQMLYATVASAANIPATQDASLLLGASSYTSAARNARSDRAFTEPRSVQVDDSGRVLVTDPGNSRLAVYNSFPATDGAPFDYVVGAVDRFNFGASSACTLDRFWNSDADWATGGSSRFWNDYHTGAYSGGGRLVVADPRAGRMLLYNSVPTTDGAAADLVLGQTSATYCPRTTSATDATFDDIYSVWTDGTRIVAADYFHHRVLIWTSWPTTNGQAADIVLGQTTTTANTPDTGGISAATMDSPTGVWSDGTKLLVVDRANNRVLVWDTFPTTTGQAATWVIGQTTTSGFGTGCTAAGLNTPTAVSSNGTKIAIADRHRVLLYDTWPTSNGESATRVLGQSALNLCNQNRGQPAIDAGTLNTPSGVWTDGNQVVATDTYNNRVLRWSTWPATDGALADRVLGHTSMSAAGPDDAGLENIFQYRNFHWLGWMLPRESGIYPFMSPNGDLWTSTSFYSRVTRHIGAPSSINAAPDWVVGQSDPSYSRCHGTNLIRSSTSLCHPGMIWTDGTKLLMVDISNNRVKVWNTYPTSPTDAPDFMLGQTTLSGGVAATTLSGLSAPVGVASDGTRIAVTDSANNRVMLWDAWPTANGQAASRILGQPLDTSNAANNGGISAQSMYYPMGVAMWDGKLAVSDSRNNRILIWHTWPSTAREAATGVYGQTSFAAGAEGDLSFPNGVSMTANSLFVADKCTARYIDPIPLSGEMIGTGSARIGGARTKCATVDRSPAANHIQSPSGITALAGKIWVGDSGTARMLRFDDVTPPLISTAPSVTVSGTSVTVSWSTSESGTSEVYLGPANQGTKVTYGGYTGTPLIDTQMVGLGHSPTLTGLARGKYLYRIRTVDWAGNEVISPEYSFQILPPTAPVHQSPADGGTWVNSATPDLVANFKSPDTAATGSVRFELCGTSPADPWSDTCTSGYEAGTIAGPIADGSPATWKPDTELTQGATYYWRARGTDERQSVGAWSTPWSFRVDFVRPLRPPNVRVTESGQGKLVIEWDAASDPVPGSGILNYDVWTSTNGTTWAQTCPATTALTCTLTGLGSKAKVYFWVRSRDVAGNVSDWATLTATAPTAFFLRTGAPSNVLNAVGSPVPNQRAMEPPFTDARNYNSTIVYGNAATGGSGIWFLLPPGTSNSTTSTGQPSTAPYSTAGRGWVIDEYAGRSTGPGEFQLKMHITSTSATGVGKIICRGWRVQSAGSPGSMTGTPAYLGAGTASFPDGSTDVTTGNTPPDTLTCRFPGFNDATSFATNEVVYVEAWLHMTTKGAAGGSVSIAAEASTAPYSLITGPYPGRPPVAPVLTSPLDAVVTNLQPTLAATYDHPDATGGEIEFQVASDTGFTTIVDSGISTPITGSLPATGTYQLQTALTPGVTYYWRARARDEFGRVNDTLPGWTNWRTIIADTRPGAPTHVAPLANADTSTTPVLEASAFSDANVSPGPGPDSHAASQWQVRTDLGDWSTPARDSGTVTSGTLTSWQVPSGSPLAVGTYWFRVRYRDSYGLWSTWSSQTRFHAGPMASNITVTEITDTTAKFTWTAATGATNHRLELFTAATCSVPVSTTEGITSPYVATGLTADRAYWYRITTMTDAWGAPSACAPFSTANGRTQLTVAIDSSSVNLGSTLGPGDTGTGSTTVSITTFGATGYNLAASGTAMTAGLDTIAATSAGTVGSPPGSSAGTWTGSGFGFTVATGTNIEANWGNGTKWAAIPATPQTIHATGAALTANTANTTQTRIDYRLDVPPSQAAGAYSATVTYTATATP